jgi:hypothetical protein
LGEPPIEIKLARFGTPAKDALDANVNIEQTYACGLYGQVVEF